MEVIDKENQGGVYEESSGIDGNRPIPRQTGSRSLNLVRVQGRGELCELYGIC